MALRLNLKGRFRQRSVAVYNDLVERERSHVKLMEENGSLRRDNQCLRIEVPNLWRTVRRWDSSRRTALVRERSFLVTAVGEVGPHRWVASPCTATS
jgi:hypothetical protein